MFEFVYDKVLLTELDPLTGEKRNVVSDWGAGENQVQRRLAFARSKV